MRKSPELSTWDGCVITIIYNDSTSCSVETIHNRDECAVKKYSNDPEEREQKVTCSIHEYFVTHISDTGKKALLSLKHTKRVCGREEEKNV